MFGISITVRIIGQAPEAMKAVYKKFSKIFKISIPYFLFMHYNNLCIAVKGGSSAKNKFTPIYIGEGN